MQALGKPPFAIQARGGGGGGTRHLPPPSSTRPIATTGPTGTGNPGWIHVQQGHRPSLAPGMEYNTFPNQQQGPTSYGPTGRVPDSRRAIRSSSSSTSTSSSVSSRAPSSTNSTPMSSKAPTPTSSSRGLEAFVNPFGAKPASLPNSGQRLEESIEEEWEVVYPDD